MILVTGSGGFVGSNLTKALKDSVVPFDKKNSSDLRNFKAIDDALSKNDIETVFHLAAVSIVGEANSDPLLAFEVNIRGTWNLLEACRKHDISKVIVASSDKAYGEHKKLPYLEDFKLDALHPYDVSKACEDMLARTYHHTYGLPVAVTRFSNIYGGGDKNFSRIIPDTMRAVIQDKNPVIRSDGTPIRDYIYISDVVNAYLTLERGLSSVRGEALNFGTDSPISVIELVDKIIKISNKNLKPKILGKGKIKGEIDRQYMSSKKAKDTLGWEPKFNLDEGLRKTYEWYKNYLKN